MTDAAEKGIQENIGGHERRVVAVGNSYLAGVAGLPQA
jgi:hypothetical protein